MSSGHSMDIEDDVSDEEEEDNASDISIYSGVNTHQPFKVKTPDEVVSKMNVEIKELGELMHVSLTRNVFIKKGLIPCLRPCLCRYRRQLQELYWIDTSGRLTALGKSS